MMNNREFTTFVLGLWIGLASGAAVGITTFVWVASQMGVIL